MAKYRIRENKREEVIVAEVWRWYWPFWMLLKGYHTAYAMGFESALRWCQEAIEKHKAGLPLDEPEWKVILEMESK